MIVSSQTTGIGPNKVILDFVKSGTGTGALERTIEKRWKFFAGTWVR